jgi:hypothetical protein
MPSPQDNTKPGMVGMKPMPFVPEYLQPGRSKNPDHTMDPLLPLLT